MHLTRGNTNCVRLRSCCHGLVTSCPIVCYNCCTNVGAHHSFRDDTNQCVMACLHNSSTHASWTIHNHLRCGQTTVPAQGIIHAHSPRGCRDASSCSGFDSLILAHSRILVFTGTAVTHTLILDKPQHTLSNAAVRTSGLFDDLRGTILV